MREIVFSVIQLLCGLAFFLYGMNVMSGGLRKMAGGKLESLLKTVTSNPFTGILLGMVITVAIQSSSAMTVMLVGLVNSGIMELSQTFSVILGSNIGTTVTAWITSLSAVNSDNFFLALLQPANFAGILAFVGILLFMAAKKQKKRDVGTILIGFAVLMFGMELMSDAVRPLSEMEEFRRILLLLKNPLLGVLVGTVFTAIIQSSAASIGILQALTLTGNISYSMAIPIILGLNIGTCATALISSIGVSKPAKRVAVMHTLIKIIGAAVFMVLLYGVGALIPMPFLQKRIDPFGVAFCHMVFNILNTVILLPFPKLIVKLTRLIVPDGKGEGENYSFVDDRLLKTPSFAIAECFGKTVEMADMAARNIRLSVECCEHYSEPAVEEIERTEPKIDRYEDQLGTALVKLSALGLSEQDSRQTALLLHTIGDFERIGDHAVNLVKTAREINEKQIRFSDAASADIAVLRRALEDILTRTLNAFKNDDLAVAKTVEPLEQVIDRLTDKMKSRHIERLQQGGCTIEMGFVFSDLLNNVERVSDHCSNVAVALIELANDTFRTHEYLGDVKAEDSGFKEQYLRFKAEYSLPQ